MTKSFNVFANDDGDALAVKAGWSWPAFFFGAFWALFKRLWGLAIILVGIKIALNLARAAFFDLESSMGVTTVIAIHLFVEIYIGAKGNEYRERDLKSRGFTFKGSYEANHADYAVGEWKRRGALVTR